MRHRRRPGLRLVGAASSLTIALFALLVGTVPVAAECVQFDRWPSFRDRAPGSVRVVVGRVAAALSEDSADNAVGFRLRVREVLRGSAGGTLEFDGIRPPGPLECPDSVLRVHVGDVIALAFVGKSGDAVRAVAFVEGKPDRDLLPGIEQLSLAEVRRLTTVLPPTDTIAESADAPSGAFPFRESELAAIAGVLATMGSLALLRRRRQSTKGM